MDLHKAIRAIHSSVVTIIGNNQNNIIAKDINENEVIIDWTQVNAWTNPDQYKIDRAKSYPTIQEQLDMQYWDNVNGTTTWKDAIAKVKSDNPKENN